ncbi:hypothetical protein DXV75_01765 [Alteromonas aestuariivivens]|uniref:Uncharacterized protein n=1 Tax=Alteromonas aestuariivivens TaxID=1938339 RepID=A0A3D8MF71_9ALTE|nr:hypothetical protein [Alteromonas aestuariivivens]RDV29211.1 hypothetical protein DXV75_01765 [Alteromonas aestuariivivens]
MSQSKFENGRRSFVKKVAVGTVVSSLPAQSVWGACNASGISGGSRVISLTCSLPDICGGWSPGSWQKFVNGSGGRDTNGGLQSDKLTKLFTVPWPANDCVYDHYYDQLQAFFAATTLTLGDGGIIPKLQFNIAEVFSKDDTGNSKMDLSALYLNCYFGLATWDTLLYPTLDELMNAVWAGMCVNMGTRSSDGSYGYPTGSFEGLTMESYLTGTYKYESSPKGSLTELASAPLSCQPSSGSANPNQTR